MEWHECYFKRRVTKLRQDELMDDRKLSSFSNRGLIVSVLTTEGYTNHLPLIFA